MILIIVPQPKVRVGKGGLIGFIANPGGLIEESTISLDPVCGISLICNNTPMGQADAQIRLDILKVTGDGDSYI